MKYLFVIAMKREANKIIEKYDLKKITDNYYKSEDTELIITTETRNGVTSSLLDILYNYNLDYRNYVLINIGMVGSNNLKIGDTVMVDTSYGYNFDSRVFGVPLYHAPFSPFKLDTIKGEKCVTCFTSDAFVTSTDIKEDAIFDMELNIILTFKFKKNYSIKIVSNSLNNKEFEDFDYDEKLEKIFDIVEKIKKEN